VVSKPLQLSRRLKRRTQKIDFYGPEMSGRR
jgi:hypothetical protein